MEVRNCPICSNNKSNQLFKFTYDYLVNVQQIEKSILSFVGFKNDSYSSIVCCSECDFIYIREDYEFDKKYEEYWKNYPPESNNDKFGIEKKFEQRRIGNLNNNKVITQLLMLIQPPKEDEYGKSKWLDYGCGRGNLALMANGINFVDIIGYDLNNYYLKTAAKKGLKTSNIIDDVIKLGKYDCIICTEVLEHVSDPLDLISFLYDNLCPGGILYITLPLNSKKRIMNDCSLMKKNKLISTYHLGHINYFTYDNFKATMNKYGFQSCKVQSIWGGLEITKNKLLKMNFFKIGILIPLIKLLLGKKYNLFYFRK